MTSGDPLRRGPRRGMHGCCGVYVCPWAPAEPSLPVRGAAYMRDVSHKMEVATEREVEWT